MSSVLNIGAIFAGGNGSRLQPLTRLMYGDDRPKQFCRFLSSHTLLGATRARICPTVAPEHTLYVVTSHHEPFYRQELADVDRGQLIEQPSNRGTSIAFSLAVAQAEALGGDAVLGCFPADHHYEDVDAFRRTIDAAYAAAWVHPELVILVGAEADRAETEYGWIEGGARVGPQEAGRSNVELREVKGFVEKPTAIDAEQLLARRCLWNTFVLIGRVRAFRALMMAAIPSLYECAAAVIARSGPARTTAMADLYASVPESDFSREVLSTRPERLGVIALGPAGWTDLGQSTRVLHAMRRAGLPLSIGARAAS